MRATDLAMHSSPAVTSLRGARRRRLAVSLLGVLVLIAALTAAATEAMGQSSGSINAVASVGNGVNVTATQALTWPGGLFPGVSTTIAATDPAAGAIELDGAGGDEVSVSFTFPSTLTGPGGTTLPLDTWTLCYGTTTTQGACTLYPVASLPLVQRLPKQGGRLYLWVGTTARPGVAQTVGSYTGQLAVLALYTGN